jgi:hypothetical protein
VAQSGCLGSEKLMRHDRILINAKARVAQFGVSTVSKSVKLGIVGRSTMSPAPARASIIDTPYRSP